MGSTAIVSPACGMKRVIARVCVCALVSCAVAALLFCVFVSLRLFVNHFKDRYIRGACTSYNGVAKNNLGV